MILEGVRAADIGDDRARVPMPAQIHDAREIHAPARGFSDVPGPQGVRPKGRGVEPGGVRVSLAMELGGWRYQISHVPT
jgi:hypothetical protein